MSNCAPDCWPVFQGGPAVVAFSWSDNSRLLYDIFCRGRAWERINGDQLSFPAVLVRGRNRPKINNLITFVPAKSTVSVALAPRLHISERCLVLTTKFEGDCMRTKKNQKGFSLIELLIVVAIILIIAAIAIPNLLRSRMAANEASAV